MDRPIDTETAVSHWRSGHLNKEGLLCTRWLSDPSPTTRSFDRTSLSLPAGFSSSLSLSLSALRMSVCSTSTQSTPSSINEPASIYSLLHRPNPDFPALRQRFGLHRVTGLRESTEKNRDEPGDADDTQLLDNPPTRSPIEAPFRLHLAILVSR